MLPASLILAFVLTADEPNGQCPTELFRIERSKNANVVLYEAKPAASGAKLDPAEPVTASWLMLASDGKRESLNFFERSFAYGFDVERRPTGEAALTLRALKQRVIRVSTQGACPAAFAEIGGGLAVLKRIYVKSDERGPVPSVIFVELFGVDATTGEPRYEKLVRS